MINLINEMVTFTLNKRRTGDASGGYTECVTSNPSDMADHAYAGALYPITVIVTGGTSLLQVGHRIKLTVQLTMCREQYFPSI
jgi:hypothetical protein